MATKLPGSFNTKTVEGRMGDFTPIKPGEYRAKATKTERKPTKATSDLKDKRLIAKGVHLYTIEWEITEKGEYKGRKLFSNLNLEHEKENVREIAEKELASICDAVGKVSIDDLDEIKGIEIILSLGIQKATANYPESNKIKGYKPLKGVKKPALDDDEEDETPPFDSDEDEDEAEAPKPKAKKKVSFD